ncbi:MAG: UMP kinase [Lentisphaeria bacterium]|nr:UMP kinase [Lentisphaeria bacterium]
MEKSIYSRVLLKLSGETLKGARDLGYEADACRFAAERIRAILDAGVELAVVVGAGNLWRGGAAGADMNRVDADKMGMLATAMNALAIKNCCNAVGIPVLLQCAIPTGGFLPEYDRETAIKAMESGKLVVFAGGTGNPFFTTDTASVLRALETECDAVFKATKVDGVYSADPKKFPEATRYGELSFDEAIARRLKVMDASAFSLCRDHELPIVVFDFFTADLERVLAGDTACGTIVS